MSSLNFFPTLTDELLVEAGISAEDFKFSYSGLEQSSVLKSKGASTLQLEDPLEIWKVETDGLSVTRELSIEYPDLLKGSNGLVCKGAEFGICIIWTNRSLSQMGYILPEERGGRSGFRYFFSHSFRPGELMGELQFETVVFVKTEAEKVLEGEENLINKAGVTVGTIDEVVIRLSTDDMDFPIKEIADTNAPLWWLDLDQWEDPTNDPFTEEYVCLYLNTAHSSCPFVNGNTRDVDMLVEIISTAYLMMFQEIISRDCLRSTLLDINLAPGSIAKVLNYFYLGCDPQLRTESVDGLQKTIHMNIEKMLKRGEADDD